MIRTRTASLPAAAVAALALAGCGQTVIDQGRAQQFVRSHWVGSDPLTSVKCPSGVAAKAGTTLNCQLATQGGHHGYVTVHIVDNKGGVEINPSDLHPTS